MPTSSTHSSVPAPSTNARGANRRPPKLRSSCDACGAAKVRCDKTQPRCGRCAAGGITCVYGLSRKFGKAPRKKAPTETGISENAASKAVAQSTHQNSLQCFPDYRPLSGGTARAVKYEPRSATSPSFGLEDSLMAFTSHGGHDMFMPSPDNSMDSFNDPFSSFSDAPHHSHNAILRADPRHHGTVDPLDLTFSASDYSTFSEWIQPDDLMHTPESQPASDADSAAHMPASHRLPTSFSSSSLESFPPGETAAAANTNTNNNPPPSLLQADSSHHCQKLAYATLDSLGVRQDGGPEQQQQQQTMDKVLNRNKQAVDNMRQLLACPCSRSPHLAMLYASITSKILMWYQLAAGCASRPTAAATTTATWDSFPPLDGNSGSNSCCGGVGVGATTGHYSHSQPTPPLSASSSPVASPVTAQAQAQIQAQVQVQQQQHKGFVVTPMQFSVGAFSVDDEAAQEALRTQLLLSELRKAGHLIDLLCMQGGRPGESAAAAAGVGAAGAAPGGEVNDIYSALGTWLKCELNRTVGSLQS